MTRPFTRLLALADDEAARLGQAHIGDEHLFLALLHQQHGTARRALADLGVLLESARAALDELLRDGAIPAPRADDRQLLATFGVDLEQIREKAVASFGYDVVAETAGRLAREHHTSSPFCGRTLLAKRALEIALKEAERRPDRDAFDVQLLLGLLTDAETPMGTRLSRRGTNRLRELGFNRAAANPLKLLLERLGTSIEEVRAVALAAL